MIKCAFPSISWSYTFMSGSCGKQNPCIRVFMFSKNILRPGHKHHTKAYKKDMMPAWVGLNMRLCTHDFQYTVIGILLSAIALFTCGL